MTALTSPSDRRCRDRRRRSPGLAAATCSRSAGERVDRAGSPRAARRTRDGVHRSRDRRARRQRPARALRLLSRDVCVPAAHRRRARTFACSRRWRCRISTRTAGARCCAVRSCRRRCTCSPAVLDGTRTAAGAIALAALRVAARCVARDGAGADRHRLGRAARARLPEWLDRARAARDASRLALGAAGGCRAQPVAVRGAAAAPFVRVLAEMFGPDPTDASLVLPRDAARRDVRRAGARLHQARGGGVRVNALARVIVETDRIARRRRPRRADRRADGRSRAVPWFALRTLFGRRPPALARDRSTARRAWTRSRSSP